MGFRFKYARVNPVYREVYPEGSTLAGMVATTDYGKLITAGSTGGYGQFGGLPIGTTADLWRFYGILHYLSTNTTSASTSTPMYVAPILPGEIIEADYSTTVERSTGTSVIATTNRGYWFGLGGTTATVLGNYIDPSVCSTAPGTTNGMFFQMHGFSTSRKVVWGVFNSTHLVP